MLQYFPPGLRDSEVLTVMFSEIYLSGLLNQCLGHWVVCWEIL